MDTASNTSVKANALHFTEELANERDEDGLEDLIMDTFPEIDLRVAEFHEEEYTQDGGRYYDLQLHIGVPARRSWDILQNHIFVLDEDEWLVEDAEAEFGYTIMSDRKYRELNK